MTYTFAVINNLIDLSYGGKSIVILQGDLGLLSFYFPRITIALKVDMSSPIVINTAVDTVVISSTVYSPGNGENTWQSVMGLFASLSTYTGSTETDPIFSASTASNITFDQVTNWDTAFGWGNPRSRYIYNQGVASSTWVINHNLQSYPPVTIVDSANDLVIGDVHYNSSNQLTINFAAPFAGTAYL